MVTLADWGGGGPGPWILLMPLVWAAVVIGVVTALRRTGRGGGRGPWGYRADRRPRVAPHADAASPLAVLGRRFAAGEIDEDEYWRRQSVLDPDFGARPGDTS
ncbi:SHOCT domain-containing protein [Streptomyces sp. NPDC005955]|uniref:SHOCT domain-containing protein n=1 Tax=Streptomyces sp. NPDC005955 TaxID=3364738 RepID=UPI0036CA8DCF